MPSEKEAEAGAAAAPLLFLVGATASGKKKIALEVAKELPVELLSLDSMKVYRGMDLGTDKLAPEQFALTNLVDASERFSVGAYVRAAAPAVAAIRARGRAPLFVGGTGLYLRALVRGLFEVPAITSEVRQSVGEALDTRGVPALHEELAAVDPPTAARLHPNDRKRIARALEVWRQTGRRLSAWQSEATRVPIPGAVTLVGIRWSRARLRERIVQRVDRMFAEGLVDEVRRLFENASIGATVIGTTAGLGLGYRQVAEMLRAAPHPESQILDHDAREECRRRVIHDTTTFVRRQENWFRQFPEIDWLNAEELEGADSAAIVAKLASRVAARFRAALAGDACWTTGGSGLPSRS